jgi:hypothetical protein
MKFYKTEEDTNAVIEVPREEWSETTAKNDPVIARTLVRGVFVETFFRGYDASTGGREPELWRTRVTAPGTNDWPKQLRYKTRSEAFAGHIEYCDALTALDEKTFTAGLGDDDGR